MEYTHDPGALGHDLIKYDVISNRKTTHSATELWAFAACLRIIGKHQERVVDPIEQAIGGADVVRRNKKPDLVEVGLSPCALGESSQRSIALSGVRGLES